jgi:hypothetical protein
MVRLANQVLGFRNYFVGIGLKMRIMNKYIAGLFKNIRTAEFRIRIAVAATGIKSRGV